MNNFLLSKICKLYFILQLKKHQWQGENELKRIQEKSLRSLIKHAYYNVPYYHELFNSKSIKPQDIRTLLDLRRIPILTKEIVRNNYPDKIVSKGIDIAKCYISSTTGSTGIPLKIAFSSKMQVYSSALRLFVFNESGLRLTDKLVSIRHSGFPNLNPLFNKFGMFKWENISIFNPIESIVEKLKNSKPDVLATYPSMLLLLANNIQEKKIVGINPRLIITSGETLADKLRNKLRNIFNADIYRIYGTEEFGRLAFECRKHLGYHIISDAAIIEVVKDNKNVGEGHQGEIVVTSLFNHTMPLIRYRLGDIGTFTSETCTCGRGFPLIKNIEGRIDDFLTLPSGKKISPRMINVIENIPGVFMYRTIQETKNKFVVNLVKNREFSENTVNDIKKHIKAGCLGENVEVEVKLVKEIKREKGSKLRAVISKVKE